MLAERAPIVARSPSEDGIRHVVESRNAAIDLLAEASIESI